MIGFRGGPLKNIIDGLSGSLTADIYYFVVSLFYLDECICYCYHAYIIRLDANKKRGVTK